MWQDDLFDDDDDLVAAFDFDYENKESFYSNVSWHWLGLSILYTPVFTACIWVGALLFEANVQWSVQAQHIGITRNDIRFVWDKHPTCWGMYGCWQVQQDCPF
jgi:hypothetical protein